MLTAQGFQIKSATAFYSFIRSLMGMATLLLSLSVSFRKDLAGAAPSHLWALQGAWLFLSLAILAGTVVLRQESQVYILAAQGLSQGREGKVHRSGFSKICGNVLWICFAAAVALFCLFAILNS